MLKRGVYIGSGEPLLQGKRALIMTKYCDARRGIVPEGKVMIQADDETTGLGYGWHEFPAEDWEIEV